MSYSIYKYNKPFELECGTVLPYIEIAYYTYGSLNTDKSNVVWVCHALTANANVVDWWPTLVGEGNYFNPSEHFIVCANILGSCYGTTGPLSVNPETGKPYYHSFPQVTVRDIIKAHQLLAQYLGIDKINTLIGGSVGGQQVLEWAISEPNRFDLIIPIATNAFHSPWGIAFNESQRLAIEADATWHEDNDDAGSAGLKAARSIALLSYRNYDTYLYKQSEENNDRVEDYKASSYQRYQGDKLVKRFNAFSYYMITKVMDSHNVGRNRGNIETVLRAISAKTLVIGISSDVLFPTAEQQLIANHIPNARYYEINSLYGHDGFLLEGKAIEEIIRKYSQTNKKGASLGSFAMAYYY